MPTGLEVIRDTFASLKEDYLSLKAIVNIARVNFADIGRIKE